MRRRGGRSAQAVPRVDCDNLGGHVLGLLKEWMIRVLNGVCGLEPLLDLTGLSIRKKLRVQVAILRDASTPLGMTATPSSAEGPLDEMQNILWNEANVTLAKVRDRVRVLEDVAPDAALRVRTDPGAAGDGLGEAGEYFRSHARSGPTAAFGYGDPITVFIVNRLIGDEEGCSLGAGTGYVILERGMLDRGNRVMVHRVGHACGLYHVRDEDNLMAQGKHGRELKRWQKAIVRNSPHVTHF